jgi:hypothetical protein
MLAHLLLHINIYDISTNTIKWSCTSTIQPQGQFETRAVLVSRPNLLAGEWHDGFCQNQNCVPENQWHSREARTYATPMTGLRS